jgi:hypothetical protein
VSSQNDTDRVINVMMFDIDETISEKFMFEAYEEEGDREGGGGGRSRRRRTGGSRRR